MDSLPSVFLGGSIVAAVLCFDRQSPLLDSTLERLENLILNSHRESPTSLRRSSSQRVPCLSIIGERRRSSCLLRPQGVARKTANYWLMQTVLIHNLHVQTVARPPVSVFTQLGYSRYSSSPGVRKSVGMPQPDSTNRATSDHLRTMSSTSATYFKHFRLDKITKHEETYIHLQTIHGDLLNIFFHRFYCIYYQSSRWL